MIKFYKFSVLFSAFFIYSFVVVDCVLASGDFEEDFMFHYKDHLKMKDTRQDAFSFQRENKIFNFSKIITNLMAQKVERLFSSVDRIRQQPTRTTFLGNIMNNVLVFFPLTNYLINTVYAEEKDDRKQVSMFFYDRRNEEIDGLTKKALDNIQLKMNEIKNRFNDQEVSEKVTVFLGNTGSGKSTIYNYVQNIPLIAREHEGSLVIDRKEATNNDGKAYAIARIWDYFGSSPQQKEELDIIGGENGAIIHGFASGTSYPSISSNGEYFDCPGFQDNRGAEQDIVNAYSLYTLFENAPNFRLVLVASKDELEAERGRAFARLIGQVGEIFPDRAGDIKRGLNLIITKGSIEENNVNSIRSKILRIRKDHQGLTDFQKEILDFLATTNNPPIAFFERPIVEGDIPSGKKLIKNQTYISGLSPHISVSPETKLYIKGLADILTNEISVFFTSFRQELGKYTKQLVISHVGTAKELRSNFKNIMEDLTAVHSQSFETNVKNIENVLERFDPELPLAFSNIIDQRKFLMRIRPEDTSINLDLNVNGVLTESSSYLQPFSDEVITIFNGEFLMFKGHIIGTSDIQRGFDIQQGGLKSKGISRLTVEAVNSLLIDSNVKVPGVSLAFVSPLWTVIGERTIDLKGKNSKEIMPQALVDKDGEPGVPGQSGGIFYGIVDELYNSRALTINVSGGRGGKGQDGGDGIDGADGIDGIEANVRERNSEFQNKESIQNSLLLDVMKWPFVANDEIRIIYTDGKLGEKGKNAGAGGKGGRGGYVGSITFKNTRFKNSFYDVKIVAVEGQDGEDGIHGIPGRGGRNGKVFEGIYVEKSINGWKYLEKATVDATAGAAAGSGIGALGGPVGILAGTIGGGTIGIVVGIIIPAVGSLGDQMINTGWERDPYMLDCGIYAPDGEVPQSINLNGLRIPNKSQAIDEEEIYRNWKMLYSEEVRRNGRMMLYNAAFKE